MRSIHSIFTDKEFKDLENLKEEFGHISWHDFILRLLDEVKN
jgi:hypothetical protein